MRRVSARPWRPQRITNSAEASKSFLRLIVNWAQGLNLKTKNEWGFSYEKEKMKHTLLSCFDHNTYPKWENEIEEGELIWKYRETTWVANPPHDWFMMPINRVDQRELEFVRASADGSTSVYTLGGVIDNAVRYSVVSALPSIAKPSDIQIKTPDLKPGSLVRVINTYAIVQNVKASDERILGVEERSYLTLFYPTIGFNQSVFCKNNLMWNVMAAGEAPGHSK